MEYFFWSNVICWVFITVYVIYLIAENRSVGKQLDSYKKERD